MSSKTDFLDELTHSIMNHPVMDHEFWTRFERGQLSSEKLRNFSLQYYYHVQRTRLYDAAVLSRAVPYEDIQRALASILYDEFGRGDPEKTHPAQFRKLLRTLELDEADWNNIKPIRELEMYIDTHYRLCNDHDVWVGLGVVGFAMELPIPRLYERVVKGYQQLGVGEGDLEFFVEHIPTDDEHAGLMRDSVIPYLDDLSVREKLKEGARRSMEARYILMEGMLNLIK